MSPRQGRLRVSSSPSPDHFEWQAPRPLYGLHPSVAEQATIRRIVREHLPTADHSEGVDMVREYHLDTFRRGAEKRYRERVDTWGPDRVERAAELWRLTDAHLRGQTRFETEPLRRLDCEASAYDFEHRARKSAILETISLAEFVQYENRWRVTQRDHRLCVFVGALEDGFVVVGVLDWRAAPCPTLVRWTIESENEWIDLVRGASARTLISYDRQSRILTLSLANFQARDPLAIKREVDQLCPLNVSIRIVQGPSLGSRDDIRNVVLDACRNHGAHVASHNHEESVLRIILEPSTSPMIAERVREDIQMLLPLHLELDVVIGDAW